VLLCNFSKKDFRRSLLLFVLCFSLSAQLVAACDFVVTDIFTEPANPAEGSQTQVKMSYTVSCQVFNLYTDIYFDGSLISHVKHYRSDTDKTLYAWGYVTPSSSGTVTIKGIVDPENQFAETNENNNMISKSISVSAVAKPDLTVKDYDISLGTLEPIAGVPLTVSYTVSNIGSGDSGSFRCKLYDNNELVDTYQFSNIPSRSGTETRRVTRTLTKGEHTFKVDVDNYNDVAEENENNNIQTRTYTVIDACDNLVCDSVCANLNTLKQSTGCSDGACQYNLVTCVKGCIDGHCRTCDDDRCTVGAQRCDGNTIQKCVDNGDCNNWVDIETCSDSEYCGVSMCVNKKDNGASCVDNKECITDKCELGVCIGCVSGDIECFGDDVWKKCNSDGLTWSVYNDCNIYEERSYGDEPYCTIEGYPEIFKQTGTHLTQKYRMEDYRCIQAEGECGIYDWGPFEYETTSCPSDYCYLGSCSDCDAQDQCWSEYYCEISSGDCVAKKVNDVDCNNDYECAGGYCVSGICTYQNHICGNGIVEGSEECDINDLNDQTCESQGFDYGTLSCSPSCILIKTACGEADCNYDLDCDDDLFSTNDICNYPGTSSASCLHILITNCEDDDNYCPNSCNANNDNDCFPVCGNGVIENGEECEWGGVETKSCGETDVGVCEYGIQERSCSSCSWTLWSSCDGAVYPSDEILNDKDDDCDGKTDENLCGNNVCDVGENWTTCLADCPRPTAYDYIDDYAPIMLIDADVWYRPTSLYFDGDYDLTNQKENYDSMKAIEWPDYAVYVHVEEYNSPPGYAFEYWFYYPWNDYALTFNFHDHDWEHIVVFVPELGSEPDKVLYYSHNYAPAVAAWVNVQKDGMHPKLYVKNDGHASKMDDFPTWEDPWPDGSAGIFFNPVIINWDEWNFYGMDVKTGDSISMCSETYYEWNIKSGTVDNLEDTIEYYPDVSPDDPNTEDTYGIPTQAWTRSEWLDPLATIGGDLIATYTSNDSVLPNGMKETMIMLVDLYDSTTDWVSIRVIPETGADVNISLNKESNLGSNPLPAASDIEVKAYGVNGKEFIIRDFDSDQNFYLKVENNDNDTEIKYVLQTFDSLAKTKMPIEEAAEIGFVNTLDVSEPIHFEEMNTSEDVLLENYNVYYDYLMTTKFDFNSECNAKALYDAQTLYNYFDMKVKEFAEYEREREDLLSVTDMSNEDNWYLVSEIRLAYTVEPDPFLVQKYNNFNSELRLEAYDPTPTLMRYIDARDYMLEAISEYYNENQRYYDGDRYIAGPGVCNFHVYPGILSPFQMSLQDINPLAVIFISGNEMAKNTNIEASMTSSVGAAGSIALTAAKRTFPVISSDWSINPDLNERIDMIPDCVKDLDNKPTSDCIAPDEDTVDVIYTTSSSGGGGGGSIGFSQSINNGTNKTENIAEKLPEIPIMVSDNESSSNSFVMEDVIQNDTEESVQPITGMILSRIDENSSKIMDIVKKIFSSLSLYFKIPFSKLIDLGFTKAL